MGNKCPHSKVEFLSFFFLFSLQCFWSSRTVTLNYFWNSCYNWIKEKIVYQFVTQKCLSLTSQSFTSTSTQQNWWKDKCSWPAQKISVQLKRCAVKVSGGNSTCTVESLTKCPCWSFIWRSVPSQTIFVQQGLSCAGFLLSGTLA